MATFARDKNPKVNLTKFVVAGASKVSHTCIYIAVPQAPLVGGGTVACRKYMVDALVSLTERLDYMDHWSSG